MNSTASTVLGPDGQPAASIDLMRIRSIVAIEEGPELDDDRNIVDSRIHWMGHNKMTVAGADYMIGAISQLFGNGGASPNNFTQGYVAEAVTSGHPSELSTYGNTTPVAGSIKPVEAGYPRNNDPNPSVGGATFNPQRTLSWKFIYGANELVGQLFNYYGITIPTPAGTAPLFNLINMAGQQKPAQVWGIHIHAELNPA